MDTVLKEPYEISIWKDVYETDGWHEYKVAIIGGDTRSDFARACNPVLTVDMYGQENFKFDMYSKYWDEDGEFVENPYVGLLINEAKVKVKYFGKWHDFIVKSVSEVHGDNFVVSYECQGYAIYELGKSGQDISFSEGQENNVQTAAQFMETTLEGSGWQFDRGTANLLETSLEQGFEIGVEGALSIKKLEYKLIDGAYQRTTTTMTTTAGGLLYFPYSEVANRKNLSGEVQAVYVTDGMNVEYDSWNYKITNGTLCLVDASLIGGIVSKYKVETVQEVAHQVYSEYYSQYVNEYIKSGAENYYSFNSYYQKPYCLVYKRTNTSVGVCLMNIPAKAAVYDIWVSGESSKRKIKTTLNAYVFDNLNSGSSYTFYIQPFDSQNKPLNAIGAPVASGGVSYSVIGTTKASSDTTEWKITDEEVKQSEETNAGAFKEVYFPESAPEQLGEILPSGYNQVFSFEKQRTYEIQDSNRFNITQDISELFEVWCEYDIQHDGEGKITSKTVRFVDQLGQENNVGFRYGTNLNRITREVKSDELVTKLYVPEIENSAAEDGYCAIADASLNPSGESFLLDFSYFINQGMLDGASFREDLFNVSTGYYAKMKNLNNQYKELVAKYGTGENALSFQKLKLESELEVEKARVSAALEVIEQIKDGTHSGTTAEYEEIIENAQANIRLKTTQLEQVTAQLEKYEEDIKANQTARRKLNNDFYTKYSRFIQEGTWTGEYYIEPNAYYFDAQKVIARGAQPKVSYQLDIVDVSSLVDWETEWSYSPYAFAPGDISSVIDPQYFGYEENHTPRREKVVVSSVTYNLDEPEKNSIEIQNYSTQFEDFFSKLNASIQSLELNKNTYAKAENFTGTGALSLESLQKSFDKNKDLAFSNANSTVSYDNTGITLTSNGGLNIVKLLGGGIILSSDGGLTWKTGIYDGEINTALLRAGQIDAEKINIIMGQYPAFKWDVNGITAHKQITDTEGNTTIDAGTYVKFNHEGISGEVENGTVSGKKTIFKLGWDGIRLNIPRLAQNSDGSEQEIINSNDNFIVYGDGSIKAKNGEFRGTIYANSGEFTGTVKSSTLEGCTIDGGKLIGSELMVGGPIKGASGHGVGSNYNFYVDGEGNLVLKGNVNLSNGNITWGDSAPVRVQYSIDKKNWFDEWNDSWTNIEVWARYSYSGGVDYGTPVLIQGKNGEKGSDGSDADVPRYITSTMIDGSKISTPLLIGNNVYAIDAFGVGNPNTNSVVGYMGYATGSVKDTDGTTTIETVGVAMSLDGDVTSDSSGKYVIVTDSGVRMSAGKCGVLVTTNGAYYRQSTGGWQQIGSGSGTGGEVVAVFG